MKTFQVGRTLVVAAAITCVFLASQNSVKAGDSRQIAAGILNGIANGLNGGQSPTYPPQMNSFPPPPMNNFPPPPMNNFPAQQFPGPITSQDPFGNSITIHPSASNPGANIPVGPVDTFQKYVPGRGWVTGTRWLGADGEWHGDTTLVDPWGKQTTLHRYLDSNNRTYESHRVNKYSPNYNRGYQGRGGLRRGR